MISYKLVKFPIYFGLIFWNIGVRCDSIQLENLNENKSSNILLDLLNIADSVLHSARQYATLSSKFESGNPMDCAEIFEKNTLSKNGIYNIWPRSRVTKGPIKAYCDMDDEGGSWTVIQRRGDFDSAKDYFYRDWISYKYGFGDPSKDFWLGNDNIFALTNQRECTVKFTLADWEGNTTFASYDEFWIDDETHNYMAHVIGFRGNAGDSFSSTNGLPFSTKDKDNDKHVSNCALNYKGAWWYGACHSSNLNGLYLKGPHESYADGVEWSNFKGQNYSLKDTVIKIRPRGFKKTLGTPL